MNTADPRHYTLPKPNLYLDSESFTETGAPPLSKQLLFVEPIADPVVETFRQNLHPRESVQHCRQCRYYDPEGRRGGNCDQLHVAVQGRWSACALSEAVFWDLAQLRS